MHLNARNIIIAVAVLGFAFLLLGGFSVATWEYTNSDYFCSNACHQVHPQEPFAHQHSQHKNVACVECHIGRMGFLESALEKVGHVSHAWALLVGYERPTYAISLQDAHNSCESCHPATTHRRNSLSENLRFLEDKENTERQIRMTMRLTGRTFGGSSGLGLNWHASDNVYYLADDPQAQHIKYVRATLPDGTVRSYHDVREFPDGAPEVDDAELRRLDCIGCHNRAGHPFPNPETQVDAALADGVIDRNLPYVKKYMMEILAEPIESEEQAQQLAIDARERYRAQYPELVTDEQEDAEAYKAISVKLAEIADAVARSQHLEAKDLDWRDFPDNSGHRDGPGCFRCHNGRLQTADGKPIAVNCTTCHSIPLVTKRDKIPEYYLEMLDMRAPGNHRNPAFMATHMDNINRSCSMCHGEIDYGTDDKSHCSNSGCHAEDWRHLDFDALRTTGSKAPESQPEEPAAEPEAPADEPESESAGEPVAAL
jgi:hypothetical protein